MASGKLLFQSKDFDARPLEGLLQKNNGDNRILAAVMALGKDFPMHSVTLVSKDINIRIKARSLNIDAEDYLNDQVIDDTDYLPSGIVRYAGPFLGARSTKTQMQGNRVTYRITGPRVKELGLNRFLVAEEDGIVARVIEISHRHAVLQHCDEYTKGTGKSVSGIFANNTEQICALDLLLNPSIDLVCLLGQAGTGKTLLALAAGVEQTSKNRFQEIIVTRAAVPISDEIGFLPGSEEEKMQPWMGAIEDNLEVIVRNSPALSKPNSAGKVKSMIRMKSMNYMRGRTFIDKFLIIDEAQNLTPKQMRTLITRAGQGTKVVCLGNLKQIDTPYLTEGGSGLTYLIDRFSGWKHSGSLVLTKCVRSRLADHAADVL